MTVYNADVIGPSGGQSAISFDGSPQTHIIKQHVLVYLYGDPNFGAAVRGYTFQYATLINYGHVIGDNDAFGARFEGDDAVVRNAAGADISGRYGVAFLGDDSILINEGSISGESYSADLGEGGTLRNSGRMDGTVAASSANAPVTIVNSGVISSASGVAVLVAVGQLPPFDSLRLTNSGSIVGDVKVTAQSDSNALLFVTNSGTITGDLSMSGGSGLVDNRGGHITGDVILGGSGSFDNRGGRVDGQVIGGSRGDIYTIDATPLAILEAAGGEGNIDTIQSATISLSLENYSNIENAALIGALNLNLTGDDAANGLYGNAGRNVLTGGLGDDTYYVQNANDRVIEGANGGTDQVITTVSFTLTAGQQIETLSARPFSSEAINLGGNAFANTLIGNNAENTLNGGGGADVMNGLGGSDTYYVDNVGDQAFEAAGAGTDNVYASVSFTLGAGQEIERLLAADVAATTAINLTGNEAANGVRGNAGANVLNGRLGADMLTGLGGADTFAFDTALGSGNVDRITDFSVVDDTISLSRGVFQGLALGALSADAFKDLGVQGATVDASDRILYNRSNGALFFDADGDGAAAAIRFATLDNRALLTSADFVVAA